MNMLLAPLPDLHRPQPRTTSIRLTTPSRSLAGVCALSPWAKTRRRCLQVTPHPETQELSSASNPLVLASREHSRSRREVLITCRTTAHCLGKDSDAARQLRRRFHLSPHRGAEQSPTQVVPRHCVRPRASSRVQPICYEASRSLLRAAQHRRSQRLQAEWSARAAV
jgi:hypothetical protein